MEQTKAYETLLDMLIEQTADLRIKNEDLEKHFSEEIIILLTLVNAISHRVKRLEEAISNFNE